MTETITVRFLGREVVLEQVYRSESVINYMGRVGEEGLMLDADTNGDEWSVCFADKRCGGQTLEQAIAKLELALTPVARVLAPLCAGTPEGP